MEQAGDWRELLRVYIASPQERQRIANALGVRPITLTRWANGESLPRQRSLHQLIAAFPPSDRATFIVLLERDMPGFGAGLVEELEEPAEMVDIPVEFYRRVLQTRATVPWSLNRSSLCDLILQQALKHLDPHRLGLGISIARCLPPANDEPVRSLLVDMGRGSAPWESNMEGETMLLGAESLAAYAVISGYQVAIANLQEEGNRYPASLSVWEQSSSAAPIAWEGRIAGALVVSSTQINYFTPQLQQLVSDYANLIALTFHPEQFYDPQHIRFGLFPSQQEQHAHITVRFRQLLLEILKRPGTSQQYIGVIQAEQLVWQQIEKELLQ
jgi:hypothetical protein